MAAGWREEFEVEGQAGETLLERVILGDWGLRRADRKCFEAEAILEEALALGRDEEEIQKQHAQVQLYLRYKTSAERSFYRAFYALRGLRKDKFKEELDLNKIRKEIEKTAREVVTGVHEEIRAERQRADTKPKALKTAEGTGTSRAKQLFQGQNAPKKMRKIAILDQWVEVEIQDGRTVTKLYPSNAGLIKEGQAMDPPPDLVYRRLSFPHGVPAEYRWAVGSSEGRMERGGIGTQRMTVDTWLDAIEREEASGTGHVGPTGVGNLPRPRERGGCDCEVCTQNRHAMERQVA